MVMISRPLHDRFWERVNPNGPGECWLWNGATKNGYGVLRPWPKKGHVLAHRVSWEIHHGPVPDGLGVLHTCDVKRCVNPLHLYAGTHSDNTRDAVERHRFRSGERHGLAVLTNEQAEAIRHEAGSAATVAQRYGVSASTIRCIRRGETYRYRIVEEPEQVTMWQ